MTETSPKADEILQTTQGLIMAGGYNGFSYADISKAVGIRKASIHHHFATKADLVRTVVARYREEATAGLGAASKASKDPIARLRAYSGFWERCIRDNTAPFCICAMLAAELHALPADVAAEVRRHFRDLAGWLAEVLEDGEQQGSIILKGSKQQEAALFMAAVHGAMLQARAYGDPAIFASITEPLFERLAMSGNGHH